MRCAAIFAVAAFTSATAQAPACVLDESASLLQMNEAVKTAVGAALTVEEATPLVRAQEATPSSTDHVLLSTKAIVQRQASSTQMQHEVAKANFKSAAMFLLATVFGAIILAMTWLCLKHVWHSVVGKEDSETDSDQYSSSAESTSGESCSAKGSPPSSPRNEGMDPAKLKVARASLHEVYTRAARRASQLGDEIKPLSPGKVPILSGLPPHSGAEEPKDR